MRFGRAEAFINTFFLFTFCLLTLMGFFYPGEKEYVYVKNSKPVLFHTIYEENPDSCGKLDILQSAGNTGESGIFTSNAVSAALLSMDTGELLYGKNSDAALPIASTTKIMTALTVLNSGVDLDSVFTVPREAVGIEGSSIYIYEGEKMYVRDLLYGLLLESGNDAAVALAICCGTDVEKFVEQMNENARKMGLVKTHFENPHGLYSEKHLSTAYELGRITFEAMKNEEFRKIVSTKVYNTTPVNSEFPVHYFRNHNKLLSTLPGAVGVKTGYTILAGRCLVSASERDGTGFIAVTLNDRQDWNDHRKMHELAYEKYKTVRYAKKGDISINIGGTELKNSEDITVVIEKGQEKGELLEIFLK